MFQIDISNCKILGQEQNGEFIICWNLKCQGGNYTVVGLFFYTIRKIQVSKNLYTLMFTFMDFINSFNSSIFQCSMC